MSTSLGSRYPSLGPWSRVSPRKIAALYYRGDIVYIVSGLPGGGKTRSVMRIVSELSSRIPVVYAAPLRKLRDYVAREFEGEVIRSKSEVCPEIQHIAEENLSPLKYLVEVARRCRSCKKRPGCPYRTEVLKASSMNRGLYCVTHHTAFALGIMGLLRPAILVIDEAEQWLDLPNMVATPAEIEEIRRDAESDPVAREILRRIERSSVRIGNTVFLKPFIPPSRLVVLVSATLPDPLIPLMPLPQQSIVFRSVIDAPMIDEVAVSPSFLAWTSDAPRGYKPREVWIGYLIESVVRLYDAGYSVGIASRNYSMTKLMHREMRERGVRVYSDAFSHHPPRYGDSEKKVVIWTTRGRWYRGVSIPDTEVVICTYQSLPRSVVRYSYSAVRSEDRGIPYAVIMNYCANTQSYFRSNRMRTKKHAVVLYDTRSHTAMKEALSQFSGCRWWRRVSSPRSISIDPSSVIEFVADALSREEEIYTPETR